MGLHWRIGLPHRLRGLGYRGRMLALAGLGLCALPVVLIVLIWRDAMLVAGLAPLFALGSAMVAAVAALAALDLLVRPVSQTGLALRRLLEADTGAEGPAPDPAGRLLTDAQRLIDELIALRAEHVEPDTEPPQSGRAAVLEGLKQSAGEMRAVVVLRINVPARQGDKSHRDGLVAGVMPEMATRAQVLFRPDPAVMVLGGSDLVFALPLADADAAGLADLARTVQAHHAGLTRPIGAQGTSFTPLVQIGLAAQAPDEDSAVTLDNALAAAAATVPGTPLVIHGPAQQDLARDRALLEQELRIALRQREFEVYYQPVIDIAAHRPVGAEALIRWHSPRRGFVSPGVFLPVAEACGLIDPIGQWVLAEACRQAATWGPDMRVSVNLGARQFLDEDLRWHVAQAVSAAGISAQQLEIGLSQEVALLDPDHSRRTLSALRDIGVQAAIDDFGTGAADMQVFSTLPFDTLKLDRRFVTDVHQTPAAQAICQALLALGQGLGLSVVAEGTEKAEEVDYLTGAGCRLFQGYYFARPVAAPVLAQTFDNLRVRKAG